MNCPTCNVALLITDREGIEIDYCPQCRGVWLDRGELDKIIERSAAYAAPAAPPPPPAAPRRDDRDDRDDRDRDDRRYDEPRRDDRYDPRYDKKKKRKGFLEDIFDFG